MSGFDPAWFAFWFVAFLLSTTCHEAAHALVARLGGDRTADEQVTLNPLPHMKREPVGMLVMPILSYVLAGWMMGWASAPFDPRWAARHPRRAAAMAAAGPAANFLLAAIAIVVLRSFAIPIDVARFLLVVAVLNGLLGCFNLLPLPPLDGASIIVGLGGPPADAIQWLRTTPMAGFVGLFLAWKLFGFLATPIVEFVRHLALGV